MEANTPLPGYAARERGTSKAVDSSCAQVAQRPGGRTYLPLVAKMRFLTAKFMRFGLVALFSAAVYSITVAVVISLVRLDGKLANIIGYVAALPLNFIGHRHFTFSSTGIVSREAIRFCLLHVVNIGVSTVGFGVLVDGVKLPFWFGILGVLVLVPISTFIVMDVWVFAEQRRPIVHD